MANDRRLCPEAIPHRQNERALTLDISELEFCRPFQFRIEVRLSLGDRAKLIQEIGHAVISLTRSSQHLA
jgi:hypothetical protein